MSAVKKKKQDARIGAAECRDMEQIGLERENPESYTGFFLRIVFVKQLSVVTCK